MCQVPDYTQNVSLWLSQALDEIGVNEKIVLKRRRVGLLLETLYTIQRQCTNINASIYNFGSQTESTTTLGLNSDTDILYSLNDINVIQDWSDWEPGVINLLMIQDESVSKGYCMLQCLRDDAPLPLNDIINEHCYKDRLGRILMKNTFLHLPGTLRHGPAQRDEGQPGVRDSDSVLAFPCKSWPIQASHWLDQQGVGGWPSDEMRRYCSNTGCFVVAVASKGSDIEELEWRISTSLAERCLMFNLNITQIRCYVLMKIILKTFISYLFPNSITSYMCKTVLLHSIANTSTAAWRENNLLTCLNFCLSNLYLSILNEVCPHFIISGNNLIEGRISADIKPHLLDQLQFLINSNGGALLEIDCDLLGLQLQLKINGMPGIAPQRIPTLISGQLVKDMAQNRFLPSETNKGYDLPTVLQTLSTFSYNIYSKYLNSNKRSEKTACCLLLQQLSKTLGSVIASSNIYHNNNVSIEALSWLSFGLDSDVASSKLKLASVLYCIGDTEKTEMILNNIEKCYDVSVVEPLCCCYQFKLKKPRDAFNRLSFQHNEEHKLLKKVTAFCVTFLPCEINCCPHELQYEVFRSTEEDLAFRGKDDDWMGWAVVDSLPYLYFLQYKTYSILRRYEEKERALGNLIKTIEEESNLSHRETALNLLGQCFELENRNIDALKCYQLSLYRRERNNAAKIHICRLLNTMINQ